MKKVNVVVKICSLLILIILFCGRTIAHDNVISLSGQWQVKLDPVNEMFQNTGEFSTEGIISLPGSLAENGYGIKTVGSDFGTLTPEYKYIGKAWYSREIDIPRSWKNKEIDILLERVLWESRIFIDGKELSVQDALGTPHIHRLGRLEPGKHTLTIVVDNDMIHNIGDKGHAYSDYTQSIWNGIVGRMEMRAFDPIRIETVRTFPDVVNDHLKVEVTLNELPGKRAKVDYSIISINTGEMVISGNVSPFRTLNKKKFMLEIPVNGQLEKWSEFTPEVYLLEISLESGKYAAFFETEFGFYQVSHDGTKILINGQPVFLRGNNDCVHFPLTGYVSTELEDWMRIFRIYKDYGLNHARFHSWCPPEAAFKAANRLGIYLQPEASIWIDWWMSTDMVVRGRPEMDTKGHPAGVGNDPERDKYIVAEMNRVVDTYGNHPSFTMFCIGNELGNADFDVMNTWISELKAKDPRRLYAASTARRINEADDYSVTHRIQDVGRTRGLNGARTNWDFEETYGQMNIPIIAHEIGQWPVYPRWSEIDKYTGVLKARNFEEFREIAKVNGIDWQSDDFADASGALNQIMYKYEIESFFRTESCAGIQLLSIQDYQGQGEALIGWLDSHWGSKGITTPERFKQHHNTTVPLLRMEKFVWTNDEVFTAEAQLAHHGQFGITAESNWEILNEAGQTISSGSFGKNTFQVGTLANLGDISFNLNAIETAQKLTIIIQLAQTEFRNQWDIWVYPTGKTSKAYDGNIVISDELNAETLEKLVNGASVLLMAHELGTSETSVSAHFYPLYWSLTFFPGQGKTCIGLLLQQDHPAFADFPTSYHSDWQWETISNDAKGFLMNDLPRSYRPIAQPVDDFHRNNKVGSIFELKVGDGKLLVSGYNLKSDLPVAKQLKYSLLAYMSTSDFNPQYEVYPDWLLNLLPVIPPAKVASLPDEFKGAILMVDAAANLDVTHQSLPWTMETDEITISEGTTYRLKSDGVWKDDKGSAWHGAEMELLINCPEGILGTLFVHFHDWSNDDRTGILEFEGRKAKLDRHDGDGQWVEFHVMREDSNDGLLVLKTSATSGPNLMITKVVLVKE
jgi:beta-galactosidase